MLLEELLSERTLRNPLHTVFDALMPPEYKNDPYAARAVKHALKRADDLIIRGFSKEPKSGGGGYQPVNFLMRSLKYDSAPRTVDKEQFQRLLDTGKYLELWRGVPREKWVDTLKYGGNFAGGRDMVVGTWTAMGPEGWKVSKHYAGGDLSKVSHLLFPKNSRIIDLDSTRTMAFDMATEIHTLERKALQKDTSDLEHKQITYQAKYLVEEFFGNPSIMAMLQGYEAIEVFKEEQLVVLNRSKLIVEK
jgi:hypothetical protein